MHTAPLPVTYRAREARTSEPALLGAGLFAAVLFSPSLLDVVLLANLALLVVVALLRIAAASSSRARIEAGPPPRVRRWAREPFVSVHVPVAGAAPDVLARTLDAIRRLEWSAFEVIVVAPEPSRAGRVERLCARLGPRFRFVHAPRALVADRAATLGLSLDASDPRTELILVVDPGARVHPKLLLQAARHFDARGVSHVQFAAADGSAGAARGLAGERASHANAFLPFSEAAEAPLPHGTPCLVQRRALTLVGGWREGPGEDAALGVRFAEHGYRGRFAPELGARGHLPPTLGALRAERRRRVFGQAHTLFHLEGGTLRKLGLRRSLAVAAQLSAGFDFLLLPALALPLLAFVPDASREHAHALFAATVAFPLHALALALMYLVAPRVSDEGGGVVRTLLARLGLAWEGSTAWVEALFGVRLAPPPGGKAPRSGSLRDAAVPLLVAATLAASAGGFYFRGQVGAALLCGLAAGMFGAVLYVRWELSRAARSRHPGRADAPREAGVRAARPRWSRRESMTTYPVTRDRVA